MMVSTSKLFLQPYTAAPILRKVPATPGHRVDNVTKALEESVAAATRYNQKMQNARSGKALTEALEMLAAHLLKVE